MAKPIFIVTAPNDISPDQRAEIEAVLTKKLEKEYFTILNFEGNEWDFKVVGN